MAYEPKNPIVILMIDTEEYILKKVGNLQELIVRWMDLSPENLPENWSKNNDINWKQKDGIIDFLTKEDLEKEDAKSKFDTVCGWFLKCS